MSTKVTDDGDFLICRKAMLRTQENAMQDDSPPARMAYAAAVLRAVAAEATKLAAEVDRRAGGRRSAATRRRGRDARSGAR